MGASLMGGRSPASRFLMRLFGRHHHNCDDPFAEAPVWAVELDLVGLTIIERLDKMSKEMDDLTAQVKANGDLLDSATTLINGIAARITAAGVDPTKLAALTAELKAKDDEIAAAITANTPAV